MRDPKVCLTPKYEIPLTFAADASSLMNMCHGKIAGIGQNLVLDSLWRAENGNLSVSVSVLSWRGQAWRGQAYGSDRGTHEGVRTGVRQ